MDVILTNNSGAINWGASGQERIVQNVSNLLNTYAYEVPYDRTLGLKKELLDLPMSIARVRIPYEVTQLIQDKEPRVTVKSVQLLASGNDGNFEIQVVISL